MKEIKITQGRVVFIDDEDYERINQFKWHLHESKYSCGNLYARRSIRINGIRKKILMHREIMNCSFAQSIDHIDRNGLNNQKINLRICTKRQNTWNKKVQKGREYKGVRKRYPFYKYINAKGETIQKTRPESYQAVIICNSKSIYLGEFRTEIEAAIAYNNGAKKYYGEFAVLNIISKRKLNESKNH